MNPTTTTRTIDFILHQLLAFEVTRGHTASMRGRVRPAEAGGANDTFGVAGEAWRMMGRPVVLDAPATVRARQVAAVAPDGFGVTRWQQRIEHALRRQMQRLRFGPSWTQPRP